ncbi:Glycosyl transferase 4-like domain-containing protein [Actinoalloteichus cyanogriseus DSM 43889]|uniref:Glycosyl transferase 4-like domain-containing protein n=1 Tax=Actinoalloteichus caeruleus DSM 43889 TaxID=1120930 RepID=A0ABT1JIV4_ACTCY|nr:Glycosyl transferase 4-like domain-containing protein [Actinoalloteichus caeruleus DSM 43889]
MRVLMLSWEYPPVVVGGLGRHVHALATRLARQGHEVVVLARHPAGSDATTHPTVEERREGVRVLRVAEDPPHLTFERDLVAWTLAMGHSMVREGMRLLRDWRPRVVHAHDWLVAHAATALADAADVPLVATLHATEAGRHSGWLSHSLNQQVHSVEWWLANRADLLITCSAAMRREVTHLFDVDAERVVVLHNGIDSHRWTGRPGTAALAAAPPPVPATGGAGASRDDTGGQRPPATRVAPAPEPPSPHPTAPVPRSRRAPPGGRDRPPWSSSDDWSGRRACRTSSPRCPRSAATTRAPRSSWRAAAGTRPSSWPTPSGTRWPRPSGSSGTSPTNSWRPCCPPPTPPSSPAGTSPSGSSPSKRRPPACRWSPPPPAASPRWSGTGAPASPSHPGTSPGWPRRSARSSTTRPPRASERTPRSPAWPPTSTGTASRRTPPASTRAPASAPPPCWDVRRSPRATCSAPGLTGPGRGRPGAPRHTPPGASADSHLDGVARRRPPAGGPALGEPGPVGQPATGVPATPSAPAPPAAEPPVPSAPPPAEPPVASSPPPAGPSGTRRRTTRAGIPAATA